MPAPSSQYFISRIGGLKLALELTLDALAVKCGKDARAALESLRDEAINSFKNADIPADREMEHAEIVSPAIEGIEIIFNAALRNL